ncbi:MAG: hypothetical protein EAZ09_19190 [Oscillatoriales cyanobacterium]|nr:MAG: hypothetical protein EAZ18_18975 [Oscillatoriales cyanobacterium]TAH17949.1 MAG: hypothetical protein EAZ09_19190 [Oscillatoriales cyanobacterium]
MIAVNSALKIELILYHSAAISSFCSILSTKTESIMSETKDTSLFTEITNEESASVNGGHYRGRGCYRPVRRHVVYRRNCNGTFRAVVRYW